MAKPAQNVKPKTVIPAKKTSEPVKEKTPEQKAAATAAPPKKDVERPKYGVPQLAEALGTKPASVRVQLRNREVPKNGKTYGWNTKAEFEAVVKQLKVKASKAEKASDDEDADEDEERDESDDEGGDDDEESDDDE